MQATRAAQLVGQVTASLSADDDMDWFAAPVEAEALGLVDYHNVVSEPMDLGTVGDCVASKVQVSFNLRCVVVCVRCFCPYSVVCISRGSCPSLGRNQGRGAEMALTRREARSASRRWRGGGLDDALRRRRREDNLTHWSMSTQVRGPC